VKSKWIFGNAKRTFLKMRKKTIFSQGKFLIPVLGLKADKTINSKLQQGLHCFSSQKNKSFHASNGQGIQWQNMIFTSKAELSSYLGLCPLISAILQFNKYPSSFCSLLYTNGWMALLMLSSHFKSRIPPKDAKYELYLLC
jgi:hypothetical protein